MGINQVKNRTILLLHKRDIWYPVIHTCRSMIWEISSIHKTEKILRREINPSEEGFIFFCSHFFFASIYTAQAMPMNRKAIFIRELWSRGFWAPFLRLRLREHTSSFHDCFQSNSEQHKNAQQLTAQLLLSWNSAGSTSCSSHEAIPPHLVIVVCTLHFLLFSSSNSVEKLKGNGHTH